MRRLVLITTMAFIAGLFTVSQGLGAGEYGKDKVSEGAAGMEQGAGAVEEGAATVAGVQMDSSQISEMQRLLSEKGYDPGATDGVIGSKTQEAIRNFQESEGLASTGQPDEETLRALAPDAETQEMLGLSPEFGQDQMQQDQMQQDQMQQQPMEQEPMQEQPQEQMESPSSSEPTGTY